MSSNTQQTQLKRKRKDRAGGKNRKNLERRIGSTPSLDDILGPLPAPKANAEK